MEWTFQVKGSAPQPYAVKFKIQQQNLTATCTCPDFSNGYCCKHILGLLTTNTSAPVFKLFDSDKQEKIKSLLKILPDTDVFAPLEEFLQAKKNAEEAKVRVNSMREQLEKIIIQPA